MRLARVLALATVMACGDDGGGADDTSADTSADANDVLDAPSPDAASDAASPDAAPDSPTGLPADCTGSCRVTALTATFGGATRVLDAAYFGFNNPPTTIRVEAYNGGDPGCPTMTSATPDQTLILVAVPVPTTFEPSATNGTLLDFEGALLSTINASATSVALTPAASSPTVLAMDAELAFPTGTIAGHFYATHCDSLDE